MRSFVQRIILLLFVAGITSYSLSAQNVNGKWYGVGNVDVNFGTNGYLCEFILKQNGNSVTGYFNYFFRDGYFSNKVVGTFNARTRELKLRPIPIIFYKSVDLGTGVDAIMTASFILKVSQTESTLTGSFLPDALHAYTAPPINIRFKKSMTNEPELKDRIVKKELDLEAFTPAPEPVVTAPPAKDTAKPIVASVPTPQKPVPPQQPQVNIAKEAEKLVKMRSKDIVRILDVTDDSVRIDLYDNGEFDYDTVSVFYNNKLVQYKQLLKTREPIQFYVHVNDDETNNDLSMFAENMGLIPPNSALMIITDKNNRYEITLNSTYQKNAAVRLRKVKKKE